MLFKWNRLKKLEAIYDDLFEIARKDNIDIEKLFKNNEDYFNHYLGKL